MPRLANPFAVPGQWFRGNLHVHTTNSDGAMPPEKLVAHYAYAGWDFIALTDHWKVTELPAPSPVTAGITVIPGIEVGTAPGSTEAGTNYHIVGINVQEAPPRREAQNGAAAAQWYVDAIREQGGEATIAHPYWSGLTLRDVATVCGHLAIEVYNTDTEVHIGRGNSQMLWDDLLSHGIPTLAVAVDDCHRPGQDSLRAWTVVRAPDRSPAAIMAALRAGHFYASTGPEIYDVQLALNGEGSERPYAGTVTVRCGPARSISLVADPTRGGRLNAGTFGMARNARRLKPAGQNPQGIVDGELLTGAEFTLAGIERYARIQVEDDRGRCAWTNPLFMRTGE
ncbi:MAG: CehA/McbA family metallohydrolase [Chloroflexi bacterium]|nr:CehA/McbA family metallohydrolase [Chloroflexota bacterium]